ncbi:MAG: hypothetical protein ACO3A2_04615 [Bdellovibrionia bacterium]
MSKLSKKVINWSIALLVLQGQAFASLPSSNAGETASQASPSQSASLLSTQNSERLPEMSSTAQVSQSGFVEQLGKFKDKLKEKMGLTYFTYFNGPGLHPDSMTFNPNQIGNPSTDGVNFSNQFSFRFKFSKNLAIDFQTRFLLILNDHTKLKNFQHLRWEAPRIGISGVLLAGEDWKLVGAVNTDFPYFLPAPFSGYQARERTAILTPGLFAGFKYEPKGSRWSIFSVVSPRFFFYQDRSASEMQLKSGGFSPENKPEIILAFQPTLNYRVSEKSSLSLGTGIDYRKQVISDWNMLNASMVMNGNSRAWRFAALPINIGMTFSISPQLNIFPFISFFPIEAQRFDANEGRPAGFLETTSLGMWISGTLL